jgi:hypothetical protein
MIVASKQLKSGDLRFTLGSVKEAEIMRVHREKWAKGLCRTAFVHVPTWGVIVPDVNIRSLGINKPSIDELGGVQDRDDQRAISSERRKLGRSGDYQDKLAAYTGRQEGRLTDPGVYLARASEYDD